MSRHNKSLRSKKYRIFGVDFDLIHYRTVLETIAQWRQRGESHYIAITNPHSVLLCHRNEQMGQATAGASMTLPDGVGIIWAANLLGYPHLGRVTGPRLMLNVCDWGRALGLRHFFYGGAEGVADTLADRLVERFPGLQVAGSYCPPFRQLSPQEDEEVVNLLNASKADIVWVGLGAPKQEVWIAEHRDKLQATAMIGVGAAFDFHSGRIKWSPTWVRKLGLEWSYRLLQNPRRMWRRNLDSPVFLLSVLLQRIAMAFGGTQRT